MEPVPRRPIWPYALIGCAALILLGAVFFFSKGFLIKNPIIGIAPALPPALPRGPIADGATSLGVLTPFYRAEQLQGPYIETEPGQIFLEKIPGYLSDPSLDYPYIKKSPDPSGLEVPYVSTFSIQRSLGGWTSQFSAPDAAPDRADLTYLDSSTGQWVTQYQQFVKGLKPFLDAGYEPKDMTIVLDNVPWDLSTGACPDGNDVSGTYGNRSPVKDVASWQTFIAGFAQAVNSATGGQAGAFHYKLGSEMNTNKSYCGTLADYEEMYTDTVAALQRVIAHPIMTPYEFAAAVTNTGESAFSTISYYEWMAGQNYAPASINRSANYITSRVTDKLPSGKANDTITSFEDVYQAVPSFGDVPPEIDQFGVVNSTGVAPSAGGAEGLDDGPRKASWNFQMIFRLIAWKPFATITHWDLLDSVPTSSGKGTTGYLLPTAISWLYQVLDNLQGDPMYVLQNTVLPIEKTSNSYAVGFEGASRLTILASTYNADIGQGSNQAMQITIPAALMPTGVQAYTVRTIPMALANTPSYVLKGLIQNGSIPGVGLAAPFTTDAYLVGQVNQMAASATGGAPSPLAARQVGDALTGSGAVATAIQASIKAMFTLEPYEASALTKNSDGSYTLDAGTFEPGEMRLFVIEPQ